MDPNIFFTPTLSSLIRSKPVCLAISGTLALHLTLVAMGLPSWQCPIRHGLGIPCPTCGLSRAVLALFQGQWHHAIAVHAFAPLAIAVACFIAIASTLPESSRLYLANRLKVMELNLGITGFTLSAFLIYWLVRLLFFPKALYGLVM